MGDSAILRSDSNMMGGGGPSPTNMSDPQQQHQMQSGGPGGADAASGAAAGSMDGAVCWVCRRKFKDAAALKIHEENSELHKENLAKQAGNC